MGCIYCNKPIQKLVEHPNGVVIPSEGDNLCDNCRRDGEKMILGTCEFKVYLQNNPHVKKMYFEYLRAWEVFRQDIKRNNSQAQAAYETVNNPHSIYRHCHTCRKICNILDDSVEFELHMGLREDPVYCHSCTQLVDRMIERSMKRNLKNSK